MADESEYLSLQTIARRLDTSVDYVRKAAARGDLETVRIGSMVRVEEDEYQRWKAAEIEKGKAR